MSVAGASLVVAVGLTVFACANWLWLRLHAAANGSHLPALADVALIALALHALALIVTGTTSPPAYGLTIVLACAAAAVRRPSALAKETPASAKRDARAAAAAPRRARSFSADAAPAPREAAPDRARFVPEDVAASPAFGADLRTERPQPSPPRATLWSDQARAR